MSDVTLDEEGVVHASTCRTLEGKETSRGSIRSAKSAHNPCWMFGESRLSVAEELAGVLDGLSTAMSVNDLATPVKDLLDFALNAARINRDAGAERGRRDKAEATLASMTLEPALLGALRALFRADAAEPAEVVAEVWHAKEQSGFTGVLLVHALELERPREHSLVALSYPVWRFIRSHVSNWGEAEGHWDRAGLETTLEAAWMLKTEDDTRSPQFRHLEDAVTAAAAL
jgi:hypothetical protein